jgi:hypothetical protein
MLRTYVQEDLGGEVSTKIENAIRLFEKHSTDFSKIMLLDVSLISIQPSLLALIAVEFGLFSISRDAGKHCKVPFTNVERDFVINAWYTIYSYLHVNV